MAADVAKHRPQRIADRKLARYKNSIAATLTGCNRRNSLHDPAIGDPATIANAGCVAQGIPESREADNPVFNAGEMATRYCTGGMAVLFGISRKGNQRPYLVHRKTEVAGVSDTSSGSVSMRPS